MKKVFFVSLLALFVVGCDEMHRSTLTKKDTLGCYYETGYCRSLVEAEKLVADQMKTDGINGRIVSTDTIMSSGSGNYFYGTVVRFDQ